MQALLIADNKDVREMLSFQISSQFPIKVKECANAKDGADILRKPEEEIDLLIAPYFGPESILVQVVKERNNTLPVIFYYDAALLNPNTANIKHLHALGLVESTKLVDEVIKIIKDFVQNKAVSGDLLEFCPIRTTLLIKATPLKSDIYIRLSKEKFVKLFSTGDAFEQADLQRYYENKGVEYMYLRRSETGEFIDKFKKELEELLARPDLPPAEALQTAEVSHEAIQDLVHRIGFTTEVQDLAKKNVQLTIKAIGQNPRLSELLKKVTTEGNYLSQHSTLLAHLTCCVAKEMEWGSEATFTKLVIASFMHDISLTNPELAKINTLKELEERKQEFPEEQTKSYHLHPVKSAEIVRTFQEIPADVDLIVLHHHEKPNSAGFPRGLAHNYIAPLAAVFIICHDMAQEMLSLREKFSLPQFVSEKKAVFNQGNFKKVMTALEKVKL